MSFRIDTQHGFTVFQQYRGRMTQVLTLFSIHYDLTLDLVRQIDGRDVIVGVARIRKEHQVTGYQHLLCHRESSQGMVTGQRLMGDMALFKTLNRLHLFRQLQNRLPCPLTIFYRDIQMRACSDI